MSEHSLGEIVADIISGMNDPHVTEGKSVVPYEHELDLGMSNFDHSIDIGLETALKRSHAYAIYDGWNFNGRVWYDRTDKLFKCEVWHYREPQEQIFAEDNLTDLMASVSDEWGYE